MTITEADIAVIDEIVKKRKLNHPGAPWPAITTLALSALDQDPPLSKLSRKQATKLLSEKNVTFQNPQLPEIIRLAIGVISSATHG